MTQRDEPKGRARGAVALAEKLGPSGTKLRAAKAAAARWNKTREVKGEGASVQSHEATKATHTGKVAIGELVIDCAVLPDGRRVLSRRGVMSALGRRYGGKDFRTADASSGDAGGQLPYFLAASSLKLFVDSDLAAVVSTPIPYRHGKGGGTAVGFDATALPRICDVWLKAREAGALNRAQLVVAQRAEILMRGLAHVGIVALVDEATGYQQVRARDALQAYLEKFLRVELAAYVARFPDEFFAQLYRLKRWPWTGSSRRPGVVGRYIRDLVYERLGPGVIEELERRNPSNGKGQRRARHHQWLSDDLGHPALSQHMHALLGFMRSEDDWRVFYQRFTRAFPKRGDTMPLL